MGTVGETFRAFGALHRLEQLDDYFPGPLTPLLAKGGRFDFAHRGRLPGGLEGVLARYRYGPASADGAESPYHHAVVYAEVPESQPFVTRLVCERKGRVTEIARHGMEPRNTRLWTESERLNGRYEIKVSPYQDDNWMRQLFAPTFIDWLAHEPPSDFSFELAYGSLLCALERDEPDEPGLNALCRVSSAVARRIREESLE
jgi:hypothetical protein